MKDWDDKEKETDRKYGDPLFKPITKTKWVMIWICASLLVVVFFVWSVSPESFMDPEQKCITTGGFYEFKTGVCWDEPKNVLGSNGGGITDIEVRIVDELKDEVDLSKSYMTFSDDTDFQDPILAYEFELCKNEGMEFRYYPQQKDFRCENKS